MISDLKERERALDQSQSFIVQAPAGSGKTGLLMQRYLRLLSIVERPESIVAMTFTRKAAGEMRERVQRALLEAAENVAVKDEYQERTRRLALAALARDTGKGWKLAADPSRLQIQTIDSLCATLTRQSPVSSGFGGAGQILENARELYAEAARRALRSLVDGGDDDRQLLTRISLHFDSNLSLAEREIAAMLERRDQWFHSANINGEPLVADLWTLLQRSYQSLQDVFREVGAIDFIELTRAAIKALGTPERPSDLLYSLDYRIEHLLLDEFQDTSYHQYDFIDRLIGQWSAGDGRTVFLVGDPLQSIYRFRGAEVQLFLNTWERGILGSVQLERLTLKTNFRSTPEILSWVQEIFEPIMTGEGAGAIQFCRSSAARAAGNTSPALITLLDDTAWEEEAAGLVQIVTNARAKGSVAILVRNRSHLAKILPSLRAAGIPYEAVEIDELQNEQHVIDLLSLTRAISHVGNRTAWLACLRAPWCGLTLRNLAALTESEPDTPVLDLLSEPGKISQLEPSARQRAVRFQ
ncbi:MAG: UvrD-helicase domain-containing protein, partial [Acidobacteriaceae bacterium]|nr:UvrD-helicase domain-containing protein [Acidobacteriaceae bacterium]